MRIPWFSRERKIDSLAALTAGAAALGAVLMGYLTYLHYAEDAESVCDFAAGFSCEIVNKSVYAEILGVPVAVLGAAYFVTVIVLALRRAVPQPYRFILSFTVFSLAFGLYLSGIEFLVLGTLCLFCEISKGLMLFILGLSYAAVKRDKEAMPASWPLAAALAGLIFAGGHFALTYEPPPQRDWTKVAQCLSAKGVSMYGSYACPKCAKQKKIFGESFKDITYVECHPRGPDSQTERCIGWNIHQLPTWFQERDGKEVKRVVGVQQVADLAADFGCPL